MLARAGAAVVALERVHICAAKGLECIRRNMEVYDSRNRPPGSENFQGFSRDLLALSERSRKIWPYSVKQPVQASQNWPTDQSGVMLKDDPTLELLVQPVLYDTTDTSHHFFRD